MLFLRLKPLGDSCPGTLVLPHLLCLPVTSSPFFPFHHSPYCSYTRFPKCAMLCCVLCPFTCCLPYLECPQFHPPFTSLLCISSSKKCFRLSQAEPLMIPLCHHITLLMRSVCQFRPHFPIRLWITSILFIVYSHARDHSKFCKYRRKWNRQNSYCRGAPSIRRRQRITKYTSDMCSAEKCCSG